MADLFGTDTNITGQSAGGVNPQISGRPPSTGENISKVISGVVGSLSGSDDGVAALGDKLKQAYDKLDSDLKTGSITSVEYNRKRREAYQIARVRAGSVTGAKSMVDDITTSSQVEYKVTDAGVQEVNKATGEVVGFRPDASTPDAVAVEHMTANMADYEANYSSSSVTGQNITMKLAADNPEAYTIANDVASVRNTFASNLTTVSKDIAVKARFLPAEELAKYKTKKVSALTEQLTDGFFGLTNKSVLNGIAAGKITPEEALADTDAYYADVSLLMKDTGASSFVDQKAVLDLYKDARASMKTIYEDAASGKIKEAERRVKFSQLQLDYKKANALGELPEGYWRSKEELETQADAINVIVQAEQSLGAANTPDTQARIGATRERALTLFDMVNGRARASEGAANLATADQKWKSISSKLDELAAKAAAEKDTQTVDAADKSKAEFQKSGNLFESIDNIVEINQAGTVFKSVISNPQASLAYKDEIISLFTAQILPAIRRFKEETTTPSSKARLSEQEREYTRQFEMWKRDVEVMENNMLDKNNAKSLRNESIYSGR